MNDSGLCGDERMRELIATAEADAAQGVTSIDAALAEHPRDARLHFLKGSLLVGLKRFIGAHRAMSEALAIDPDYHLARFQLGFFELTSGEAEAALATWRPLDALPADHWMRLFADGLRHLAQDRFDQCAAALRAGMAANGENVPLNADMQLIVVECEKLGTAAGDAAPTEDVSATSFLLGRRK